MASDKGFPSKDRETSRSIPQEHITAQPVREKQWGKDVVAHMAVSSIASDTVEAGSTTSVINATAHSAQVGDIIRFTSGSLSGKEARVLRTETNSLELAELLSAAPSASDAFDILRHIYIQADSSGNLLTSVTTSGPIQFVLDSVNTHVTEDTVTPANNRPLPVKLTDVTGDINITAGDLNVQLDHTGANPDSVQIGDGTETVAINASNEMQVRDDSANTSLSTIAGDTTSLDTKMPAQGAALTAASLPVNIASDQTVPISASSLPLPTGAATEATLSSIDTDTSTIAGDTTSLDAKVPAQGAALTAASLPVNIASDQTVPVSAASLPLPTGAATEATLSSIDTDTSTIAGDTTSLDTKVPAQGAATTANSLPVNIASDQTVPVSAASLPLPTGAATEATLATIDTDTGNIATSTSNIDGKLPATLGQKTKAGSLAVTLASDEDTLNVALAAKDVTEFVRNDYTGTNVTTGAYVELIASTAADITKMQIFDSSGQTLVIATGAAASEVDKFYVFPGGNGDIDVSIPSGTRISIKAVSATADAGEISINLIG